MIYLSVKIDFHHRNFFLAPSSTDPTTTREPGSGVGVRFTCPLVSGGGIFIPHETICENYFECINTVRHLRRCPQTPSPTIFDIVTGACGDPETSLCADRIVCIDESRRIFKY